MAKCDGIFLYLLIFDPYDGEHLKATFSVSSGIKIDNFKKVKMKKYIQKIILLKNLHSNRTKDQV